MTAGINYGGPQGAGTLGDASSSGSSFRVRNGLIDWTDSSILQRLRDLWDEGYSTAEIARRMNATKNAIVGKAHRLDLPPRPSPIKRDGYVPPVRAWRVTGPTLPPLPSDKLRQGEWITEERKEILGNLWPSKTSTLRIMELLAQSPGAELPTQHVVAAYANSALKLRRPPDIRGGGAVVPRPALPLVANGSELVRRGQITAAFAHRAIVPLIPVIAKPKAYVRVGECTWTDCDAAPWLWCGDPTINGGSWCASHHRIVFNHSRYQPVEKLAGMQDAAD